jgi:hypothetical protein
LCSANFSAGNPTGIVSFSPGLRGTSYPGRLMVYDGNPEGVASSVPIAAVSPEARQREEFGGDTTLTGLTVPSMIEPRVARASQPWAE